MKRLQVKVCGMREADNILRVEALQPDYMGFICWEGSRRYVAQPPAYLPTSCRRVGVFVRPEIGTVVERIRSLGLDAVQLHGQETPGFCRQLRETFRAKGRDVEIIKAFSIAPEQRGRNAFRSLRELLYLDRKRAEKGTARQARY